nr:hypothetical protein [Planctomycetota bacterium]
MNTRTILFTIVLAASIAAKGSAAPVELVRNQGSGHVIYHDADAPLSIVMAASELQDYVHRVSGAKLALVQRPGERMICLGENAASRAAGLSPETIPWEGFRIATKGNNVFILGRDTADGERTPEGGTSAGTRNGVYAFIERFLGVRWLMPGEHGDYVPKSASVTIPETDVTDAPFFLNRRVPYTQERRREVKRWWARQRLGWSLYLIHGHNWRRTIPASHFAAHPDWFPERGGVPVPPTGRPKPCTTNPGPVRPSADATIAALPPNPNATCP